MTALLIALSCSAAASLLLLACGIAGAINAARRERR